MTDNREIQDLSTTVKRGMQELLLIDGIRCAESGGARREVLVKAIASAQRINLEIGCRRLAAAAQAKSRGSDEGLQARIARGIGLAPGEANFLSARSQALRAMIAEMEAEVHQIDGARDAAIRRMEGL